MRARDLLVDLPVIGLDSPVIDAVSLLIDQDLPGLIVVDDDGSLFTVLSATEVLRLAVPVYHQEDPILARVEDEAHADALLRRLSGRTVRSCLPPRPHELPVSGPDATVVEVAVLMMRTRIPLVAVVEGGRLLGALTLKTLLEHLLAE
ncbi:CBS domain-containing protein [Thermostaphylospora chromogena]|uniref:CBS domain-containing protein n=1 Tax=Thermostaphylospora chromogena TaxID=35622 RepID=A0A1H1H8X6_9ACTN|nr:CBS domain-containing protein [Thermostaphylospora chromogena]SDR21907.1 CBS domain-containing protein [Thermostaphylospora chromogena]